MNETLMSLGYLREQQILHAAPRGYGQRGRKWTGAVLTLVEDYLCATILDYGCGTGSLKQSLLAIRPHLDVREYDLAIPDKNARPDAADLVICTDMLEHVEGDRMDAVLTHVRSVTNHVLFVVVSLVPTAKVLTTGEQAHISLHPASWWCAQLEAHGFTVAKVLDVKPEKQWVAVLTC